MVGEGTFVSASLHGKVCSGAAIRHLIRNRVVSFPHHQRIDLGGSGVEWSEMKLERMESQSESCTWRACVA